MLTTLRKYVRIRAYDKDAGCGMIDSIMKQVLWHILTYGGITTLARLRARDALTIVLYHGVDERRDLGTYNYRGKFISPEAFDRQLAYYKKHYTVLPLDTAVDMLGAGMSLPPYALSITFDDGYRNNFTHALPLLKKYNLPATVFLTTDFVDKRIPLWVDRLEYAVNKGAIATTREEKIAFDASSRERLKKLPHAERMQELADIETRAGIQLTDFDDDRAVYAPLSWEDIAEMGRHAIMFGAHTASHPILSTLPADAQRAEIANSLQVLAQKCDAVSGVFAYPNGQPDDMNDTTRSIVDELGFRGALTTIPGVATDGSDTRMLPRYTLDATESFSFFVATVSGARQLITSLYKHYAKRS